MTSKLTREELRKRAKENINNLRFASKQRAFESARKEILADLQLAEYALEAMESEPYGFTEGERFGMVLEPRQWPAPKDGEPQLHIKEQPEPDIDTLRHAFETEEREETGGFNLHKSGIDYVDKSTQAQWEAWLVCRAAMLPAGISAVIPREITLEQVSEMTAARGMEYSIRDSIIAAKWWNHCRADMLQAVNCREISQTSTNSPVIPDGYVMVPVDLLSELRDWAHPEIEKYCEMWKGRRDSEFPALRKVIADADALLAAAPQEAKGE
ncbi:TPA: hypothetical protein ACTW5M_003427 [Raoultella planticola]